LMARQDAAGEEGAAEGVAAEMGNAAPAPHGACSIARRAVRRRS
jgi:hypothetical protein